MPRYYLSSLDSYALEAVRACDFVAIKHFDTGKECAIAEIDPPIPGHLFGLASDVTEVVLAVRHEGDALSNIREFPCFVHVARPVLPGIRDRKLVWFYSHQLGFWISGDPVAVDEPERYLGAEFGAANPYAYANLTVMRLVCSLVSPRMPSWIKFEAACRRPSRRSFSAAC